MGLLKLSWVLLLFWVLSLLSFRALCDYSEVTVKFLKAPRAFSHLNSATFVFEDFIGGNGPCRNCSVSCKLDDGIASDCEARRISYAGLQDGNHTFEVCTNGSRGIGCASYKWTIDTVPPTAYITASTPFTNALNVSVNISFSEPCTGGGGFGCSSVNACNLLVYGAGQVIPSSLNILQPNLKYSVLVGLSSSTQYGRVVVVMDKNFCTDSAGNKFTRTANSSFYVHIDRRSVFVNLRSHIPEMLLQLNGETRLVQATNSYDKLKVYLYFSKPVLNSSAEILNSLQTSQGMLLPVSGENIGDRRFGFLIANISGMAIVTLNIDSNSIISRQGTPVSPVAPVTFLYDSLRPVVRLSTTSYMRTREDTIPILIKFMKPVFGFNSSNISITGGHFKRFVEISRSLYAVELQADHDIVSVNVPENVTEDVAGNKNLASNVLQVRHYSVPIISSVISEIATASFFVTSFAAGLLTVSIASLHSTGAFSRQSSFHDPSRNLFRIACHIQVFALSRLLVVTLPVEYYEFARGLRWSIPYFDLPWETGHTQPVMAGSSSPANSNSYMSKIHDSGSFQNVRSKEENLSRAALLYGLPLTPLEYRSYFESPNIEPEAEYILDPHILDGWRDFSRIMFWLAIIGGSLILLHALLLVILKFRKKNSEKQKGYGALTFPRFEIFLIILALPCVCEASAALIRGGAASGIVVGILLFGVVSFLLLALFLFLSIGITFGKLLQYKEVHQEGRRFHWYQEIIRVTLGPSKRGQWTWKNQPNSDFLTILGPLFEDLRGPPKYMLSQISGGNSHVNGDRIIASDDETEDAEAPVIQKLFGILRIYYTLLESMRRVLLGIMAGAYWEKNWSSKTPAITLLCITSFQLFFLVLKKPFINKKVQLVEIIAVSSEMGLFATCLVLLEKEFSDRNETIVGFFMLILFLVGYIPQMVNEWYALHRQTKELDPVEKSFLKGFKIASIGFLLLFIPQKLSKNLESRFLVNHHGNQETGVASSPVESNGNAVRSSGTAEKPWSKQLREMAKASFSKEGSGAPSDPSSSRTKWSGFWGTESTGS